MPINVFMGSLLLLRVLAFRQRPEPVPLVSTFW
jgi:hypothetical protein